MTISAKLKEIYASAPNDVQYIETLSLSHSQFTKTYHVTSDMAQWSFFDENGKLITFESHPFKVVLPKRDTSGNQELTISIANAGLLMMQELEAAQLKPDEPIVCLYRVYLDVPNSYPQIDPPLSLSITDVSADANTINATATRFDVLSRAFPTEVYNIDDFPGLER